MVLSKLQPLLTLLLFVAPQLSPFQTEKSSGLKEQQINSTNAHAVYDSYKV